MRFRLFLITIGAVIVALVFTLPTWEPTLRGATTGNIAFEVFPGLATRYQQDFSLLLQEQQDAYFNLAVTDTGMAIAAIEGYLAPPVAAPDESLLFEIPSSAVIAATGNFSTLSPIARAAGSVTIYQDVDNSKTVRFEDFDVANGPNLRVILSASANPTTADEMRLNGIEVDLGALIGTYGNQNYSIAPEIDLRNYRSIVIYSASIDMIYTVAPLRILV